MRPYAGPDPDQVPGVFAGGGARYKTSALALHRRADVLFEATSLNVEMDSRRSITPRRARSWSHASPLTRTRRPRYGELRDLAAARGKRFRSNPR